MPFNRTSIISAFAGYNGRRNADDIYALGSNGLLYQLQWTKGGDNWASTWMELPALPDTYTELPAAAPAPLHQPPTKVVKKKLAKDDDDDIPF